MGRETLGPSAVHKMGECMFETIIPADLRRDSPVRRHNDASPLRGLMVIPWLGAGGSEIAVVALAEALLAAGTEVSFLLTEEGAECARLGDLPSRCLVWDLTDLSALPSREDLAVRLVDDARVDFVHVSNSRLGLDVLPALQLLEPRPVVVAHFHAEEGSGGGYPSYGVGLYARYIDRAIVHSDEMAALVQRLGLESSAVEQVPIPIRRASAPTFPDSSRPALHPRGDTLRILWAGRMADEKDPFAALEALTTLHARGVRFLATFAGDGPLRPALQSQVLESGLAAQVRVVGHVADMTTAYGSNDVLILTSRREGTPLVIAEAMAAGLPVVAFDVGQVRSILGADEGVLVDGRSAAQLAEALELLSGDARMARRMGEAGRRRAVVHYDPAWLAKRYQDVILDVLAERRSL